MIKTVAIVQGNIVTEILMWDFENQIQPSNLLLIEIKETSPQNLDVGWFYDSATGVFSAPPEPDENGFVSFGALQSFPEKKSYSSLSMLKKVLSFGLWR